MTGLRNPWVLLLSAFCGGTMWAFGGSVQFAAATAGVMLGAGAVAGAFPHPRRESRSPLRRGTRQAELIDFLDGHLRALRTLRTGAPPGLLQTSAAEALAAGEGARRSAVLVAAAVDELDATILAAHAVSGQGHEAATAIRETARRLRSRRTRLLGRLTAAVDEVACVYAGLLELSATAQTMGMSLDSSEVSRVSDTSVLLRATFAELEAEAEELMKR